MSEEMLAAVVSALPGLDVPGGDPEPDGEREEAKRGKRTMRPYIQWRVLETGFCPEGVVTLMDRIEPGQYTVTAFGPGRPLGLAPIEPVTDKLVRVPGAIPDLVIKEIELFQKMGRRYAKHGAVHKRGYLLYGPPGTGKTVVIWQIAEEAIEKFGAIVIHCPSAPHVMAVAPLVRMVEGDERPMVIMMEDIDKQIHGGNEEEVLELLDGKSTPSNVVFIATTNYLQHVPPRIRNRPSRFDRIIRVGLPDANYRRAYIESRNVRLSGDEMKMWLDDTEKFSIAHIKELVLSTQVLGVEYKEALERVAMMADEAEREEKRIERKFAERDE